MVRMRGDALHVGAQVGGVERGVEARLERPFGAGALGAEAEDGLRGGSGWFGVIKRQSEAQGEGRNQKLTSFEHGAVFLRHGRESGVPVRVRASGGIVSRLGQIAGGGVGPSSPRPSSPNLPPVRREKREWLA